MIVSGYTCNECEVRKQESNHWVIGVIDRQMISFCPWNENLAKSHAVLHICGPGCAAKVLSKAIEGWSK